ncbi:MAG: hypothetical protein RLZZ26_357, partial [Candidatus Parcubacteria bacterium]
DFEVRAGFLYLDSFAPKGGSWRWYDDESDETPSVPLAGENVAPASIDDGNTMKLRWTFHEAANIGSAGVKFRLQFATSSDFESPANVAEQGSCLTNSKWCYDDGAGVDNAVITTGVLSDSDSCVASTGLGCGTHNESGVTPSTFAQSKSTATEYEFTLKASGATPGAVYFFRAILVSATTSVPLFSGATYPSIALSGGTLSFSINGLPSATTTAGVTTNVDTTSTGVPFGALPFSGSSVAANRLTVSVNASSGYKIFAYEREQLTDGGAAEIPPVLGTNTSPLSWSDGCEATSTGCWGYHSSASVLSSGDSARFAPEDSYAQFSSDPSEVAYSAVPVTGQSTDMVYRLSVNHEQDPGDYTTELVYIVTPVF